ncbi:class I ribonucleotide reductase maintenance protein YfaE [Oceaniserpentilla sp. 4NH20-0058]|uniref:class I ribonucleotide reductase maintenance protein YfaE n=1 Tax=Oceaniserpentilla sp. 4NH20-0058 TaxID=3127660 RepID=UPI0033410C4D
MRQKKDDIDSGFHLEDDAHSHKDFQLESPVVPSSSEPDIAQPELYLPLDNPEAPQEEQQLEIQGLEKPQYPVLVEGIEQPLQFHFASNLLESLEAQGVQLPYQCREGYCGGCRTDLIEGEVAYLQEPMAWINEGEILPCCCVPKTPITLKLKG